MKIREAVPEDAATIRDIALATVSEQDEVRSKVMERAYQQEEIVRAISSSEEAKEQLFIVGEAEGDVIGFYHAIDRGDTWEVLRLYLHPAHHRQGLGTVLLTHLRERKVQPIELYVESSNEQAIAFLNHEAFIELNRIQEEVYDQPMELIHLRYDPS
ncbi:MULTISPECIES: GNAT family N-acetyltransferase [Exiguobacterium]|uniref:GNAT family N-acetyltransferase n=1 Tax=Exiguobacterium aurantiacum TaxID=33987 RepID=A0ABY5FRY5_9BACL|nr:MULTISPECIES: GNAT family N-acetyltransferase [Exiguobacterium]TCI22241.1 GNAT family N-acetyltransferase [Exiguobacterium sp. SL-9]TCI29139.1 GNAT family N-acetyltransferase [Exiguobacterium sp. SL-10]UTT43952.1 GNAT family N-acetyltransferase [Exiguobacterium aurantiacum]